MKATFNEYLSNLVYDLNTLFYLFFQITGLAEAVVELTYCSLYMLVLCWSYSYVELASWFYGISINSDVVDAAIEYYYTTRIIVHFDFFDRMILFTYRPFIENNYRFLWLTLYIILDIKALENMRGNWGRALEQLALVIQALLFRAFKIGGRRWYIKYFVLGKIVEPFWQSNWFLNLLNLCCLSITIASIVVGGTESPYYHKNGIEVLAGILLIYAAGTYFILVKVMYHGLKGFSYHAKWWIVIYFFWSNQYLIESHVVVYRFVEYFVWVFILWFTMLPFSTILCCAAIFAGFGAYFVVNIRRGSIGFDVIFASVLSLILNSIVAPIVAISYPSSWFIFKLITQLPLDSASISLLFNIDIMFYLIITVLISYLVLGFVLFFNWGFVGIRGLFYAVELNIFAAICALTISLYINLRYHISIALYFGEIFLKDDLTICCLINLDLLANVCILIVLVLTAIALTFGIEYMSREAFGYNVLATLCMFSASIVWFMLSYGLGLMIIFWEFAGLFSLLLVDTFYTRVRTTQAVSRTYAIGRFSDYWLFLALTEVYGMFGVDSLAVIFETLTVYALEVVTVTATLYNSTSLNFIALCVFIAASCKCAQFILFVWLPDAMEAPTPASALIHSSTLVVMGIFMIMRMALIFRHAGDVLTLALVCGSITIVYGAISATQTSDLKKTVAYSTISQIGYLYCGCGLLAFKETLIYLAVHAICKALLFVFVGYIVHAFGGTTSMRKMGGIYYQAQDMALYVFILCAILAGAPYTIGFIAKELIVNHILSVYTPVMCFVLFCWTVAFLCTPIYLYRVCILPFFGRPRSARDVFKTIFMLKNRQKHYAIKSFELSKLNSPLNFFMYHTRDLYTNSRSTAVLHSIFIIFVLYCGEFFILLVSGFFNTSDLLFNGVYSDISTYAITSLGLNSWSLIRNIQMLILSLMFTVSLYTVIVLLKKNSATYSISLVITALTAVLVFVLLIKHLIIWILLC